MLNWTEPYHGLSAMQVRRSTLQDARGPTVGDSHAPHPLPQVMRGVAYKRLRPTYPDWTPMTVQAMLRLCWREPHTSRPSFVQLVDALEAMQDRLAAATSLEAALREEERQQEAAQRRAREATAAAAAPST